MTDDEQELTVEQRLKMLNGQQTVTNLLLAAVLVVLLIVAFGAVALDVRPVP